MRRLLTFLRADIAAWRGMYLLLALIGLWLVLWVFLRGPYIGDNVRSRLITVERLLEAGTFAHKTPTDSTPFELSVDMVKVGDSFYSSKPPGYALLMAAEGWLPHRLSGGDFYAHRKDYIRLFTLLNQVLPYLLMLWVAFLWLREYTEDRWTLIFMLLAMSVGLLPYGYAATVNNHTVSAVLFFLCLYLTHRVRHRGERRTGVFVLMGLMAGFATSIELPGGVLMLLCFGLTAAVYWRGALIAGLFAALTFAPTLYVYYSVSGTFKPFYLQPDLYHFAESYWNHPVGKDAIHDAKWLYAIKNFIGSSGFFTVTPVLALALWSFPASLRKRDFPLRPELAAFLVALIPLILFIITRTWNYGGHCIGLRWYICFMPIWMFLCWPAVQTLGRSLWGRALAILLLLLSLPWVFQAMRETAFMNSGLEQLMHDLLG